MMGNLSCRHQYTPKAAFIVTVTDTLRTMKFRAVTVSDRVYSEQVRSPAGQAIMLGLSYTLVDVGSSPADMFDGPPLGGPGGGVPADGWRPGG